MCFFLIVWGCRNSGDITKALAAGAQTVMLGNLLAGTEESPGEVLVKNGKKIKIIRGMAGYGANLANRQKQAMKKDDIFDVVPEGVEAQVPYRGNVRDIVHQVCVVVISFLLFLSDSCSCAAGWPRAFRTAAASRFRECRPTRALCASRGPASASREPTTWS